MAICLSIYCNYTANYRIYELDIALRMVVFQ